MPTPFSPIAIPANHKLFADCRNLKSSSHANLCSTRILAAPVGIICLLAALLIVASAQAQSSPGPTNYLVTFEREFYLIRGGETFPVQVFVAPRPPNDLYSFGVRLRIESTNAVIAGVGAIQVPASLSFDGPRAPAPVIAVGSNSAAVKGTVIFHTPTLRPATNGLLATFYVTDITPGPYQLTLEFFNTLGPSEQIFVDGAGVVLDPWITFTHATVLRESDLSFELRSPIALNRQTGLFEQTVRVLNTKSIAVAAFRLLVTNLPPTWTVWNAHGQTNGHSYFQYNSTLNPGDFVDLRVEYRIPNRIPSSQPGYAVEVVTPAGSLPTPPGSSFAVAPRLQGTNGFLLEFSTLTNRFYSIQYSRDMSTWETVVPSLRGNGSRLQWIDYGPPKTDRPPFQDAQRYYRVFLLPP